MRARSLVLRMLPVGLLGLLSCNHRVEFDRSEASDIHRLAVVVRVLHAPTVELEDHVPAGKTPAQLTTAINSTMTQFEVAERIRSSLLEHLPATPPFSDLAPIGQVETALGSLLTVEKSESPPNFKDLKPLGVDGVLFVEVDAWGVLLNEEKPSLYFDGVARMFTLDGDSTIWREPVSDRGPTGGLTGDWSVDQALRALLTDLCESTGTRLATTLGGSASAHGGPSVLDNPDVKVTHAEPEEKMKPVLPFVYDVDAGPVDAGPPAKAKPAPVDAGDSLFP